MIVAYTRIHTYANIRWINTYDTFLTSIRMIVRTNSQKLYAKLPEYEQDISIELTLQNKFIHPHIFRQQYKCNKRNTQTIGAMYAINAEKGMCNNRADWQALSAERIYLTRSIALVNTYAHAHTHPPHTNKYNDNSTVRMKANARSMLCVYGDKFKWKLAWPSFANTILSIQYCRWDGKRNRMQPNATIGFRMDRSRMEIEREALLSG